MTRHQPGQSGTSAPQDAERDLHVVDPPAEPLYIRQIDVARRWGCSSERIGQMRAEHGDAFPRPHPGFKRPRFKLSDILHFEQHGTRPRGRVLFGHGTRVAG